MRKRFAGILAIILMLSLFPTFGNAGEVIAFQQKTPQITQISSDVFGAVSLEWEAVAGAEQYAVYRKRADEEAWTRMGVTTKTTYTNYTAQSGTTYWYTICAYQQDLETGRDPEGRSITPQRSVLRLSSVQNVGIEAIGLQWQKQRGSVEYTVSRREAGDTWKQVKRLTNADSWTDTSVKNGKTYEYRIDAAKTVEGKRYSSVTDPTGKRIECNNHATVKLGTIKQGLDAATVSWTAMPGAECYYVYRRQSGGAWKYYATAKTTSYTDIALDNGKTYEYTVCGVNRTKSIVSYRDLTGVRAYATVRVTPQLKTAQNTGLEAITVTWDALAGADSYRVYRKTAGESYKLLKSGLTTTSYTDTTVKNGTTYYYSVCGYRVQGGTEHFSYRDAEGIKVKAAPTGRVKIEKIERGFLTARVSWSKLAGAQGYQVYRKCGNGSWQRITDTIEQTSYLDTTLTHGKTYAYAVRAVRKTSDGKIYTDYDKTGVTARAIIPDSVAMQSAKGLGFRRARITWSAVTGADGYGVYRRSGADDWTWIANTTGTQYCDEMLKMDCEYYYTVRAYRMKNGEKIWSGRDRTGISVKLKSTIDPNKPMVAITYDDGPGQYTGKILDVLQKYNAHATFFVVGRNAVNRKDTLKRAYDLGCEIGNHSYTHPQLTKLSKSELEQEIGKTDEVVKSAVGSAPKLLRPPYGAQNDTVRSRVNKAFIMWSVDTRDWEHKSAQKTLDAVKRDARDGSIILMHDIHKSTANAAESVVSYLKNRGYQLVTVSELAYYKGETLKNGKSYRKFS